MNRPYIGEWFFRRSNKTGFLTYGVNELNKIFSLARFDRTGESWEKRVRGSIDRPVEQEIPSEIPQHARFDWIALEAGHTSPFVLYNLRPGYHHENLCLNIAAQKWMTLAYKIYKKGELTPIQRLWEGRDGDFSDTSFGKFQFDSPGFSYFHPHLRQESAERIKQIEKKIITETHKQVKAVIHDRQIPGGTSIDPAQVDRLADNVYRLIVERVKRERRQRGY